MLTHSAAITMHCQGPQKVTEVFSVWFHVIVQRDMSYVMQKRIFETPDDIIYIDSLHGTQTHNLFLKTLVFKKIAS